MSTPNTTSIKALIEKHRSQLLNDYYTFLSFPSVSSEPQFKQSVLQCANWLAEYIKDMGFEVEMWPTTGHPVIFASYMKAGPTKPTILIYNHYDVQPADPIEEWETPAFKPTKRDNEVYARGAQDNKGQCFYVLQALKMLLESEGSLPINVKLCIEGEEEMGSSGLSYILKQKAQQLKANYLAIVDLGLRDARVPAVTLGIRGLVTLDIEVRGSNIDLHSGTHGGVVYNPIHALVNLLAGLRDPDTGFINVPGFYDDVLDMPLEERSQVSFNFDLSEYQKTTGAYPVGGERQYSVLERAWIRPTLEINGISGGYTGKGFKTVIPAKASAKISCRLVPSQDPKYIGNLVANHLRSSAPHGVQVTVNVNPGMGSAVRANPSTPLVRAFSRAFEEIYGVPCEFVLDGASIPIAAELAEVSKGEIILMGLGLNTDQIHAPNEHFGLDRIENGILIMARALQLLGI